MLIIWQQTLKYIAVQPVATKIHLFHYNNLVLGREKQQRTQLPSKHARIRIWHATKTVKSHLQNFMEIYLLERAGTGTQFLSKRLSVSNKSYIGAWQKCKKFWRDHLNIKLQYEESNKMRCVQQCCHTWLQYLLFYMNHWLTGQVFLATADRKQKIHLKKKFCYPLEDLSVI